MLLKAGKKHLSQKQINIDGVLSSNNSKISEFTDLIYPHNKKIP